VKFKPSHRAARRGASVARETTGSIFSCSLLRCGGGIGGGGAVDFSRYLCVRPKFSSIIIHRRRPAAGSFFYSAAAFCTRVQHTRREVHDGKWNQALVLRNNKFGPLF
jgi:hypothetical protein